MNWLRKLFNPCAHKWELLSAYAVADSISGKNISTLYVLRCIHCGDIKQKRVQP